MTTFVQLIYLLWTISRHKMYVYEEEIDRVDVKNTIHTKNARLLCTRKKKSSIILHELDCQRHFLEIVC